MTLQVEIDDVMRDVHLSEKTIAMLLAHNVQDQRLRDNVIAYWANPRNPKIPHDLSGPQP